MRARINPAEFMALSCRVDRLSRMADTIKSLEERMDKLEVTHDESQKRIMSSIEAAAYLGISRYELYKLVRSRNLPFSKPKRKLFFDRHQINEWIKGNSTDNNKYNFL